MRQRRVCGGFVFVGARLAHLDPGAGRMVALVAGLRCISGAPGLLTVYSTVFGRTKVERARGRGPRRAEALAEGRVTRGRVGEAAPPPPPPAAARGAARRTVVPSRTPFRSTSPGARVPRACRPAPGPRRTGLGRPASRADPTPTRCTLRATHRRTAAGGSRFALPTS